MATIIISISQIKKQKHKLGTVRLGKTPKVTQLINGQDEIQTQIIQGKKIKGSNKSVLFF